LCNVERKADPLGEHALRDAQFDLAAADVDAAFRVDQTQR
jgi:hypothetical protein